MLDGRRTVDRGSDASSVVDREGSVDRGSDARSVVVVEKEGRWSAKEASALEGVGGRVLEMEMESARHGAPPV